MAKRIQSGATDIESYLKSILPAVDREIEKIVPRTFSNAWLSTTFGKPDFGYDATSLTKALSVPIWDLLDRGGKRWRPGLLILSCEAVGGKKDLALKFTPLVELVHNGCVTEDTLVTMADGTPKKIVDVREGEFVLSLDTDYSIVKKQIQKVHNNGVKKVLKIQTRNRELTATENHPFLVARKKQPVRLGITQRGRIEVETALSKQGFTISEFCDQAYPTLKTCEFTVRHFKNSMYGYKNCLLPSGTVNQICETIGIAVAENWVERQCKFEKADIVFEWKQAQELQVGDLTVITRNVATDSGIIPQMPLVRKRGKDKNTIPAEFSLEFSQLCGFLLGDGCITGDGRTELCLPADKPGRKEYEQLVEELFKHKPSLDKNVIIICSKAVEQTFKSFSLAKPALEKEIPEWVFRLPRPHKLAFVKGYLDSDGTVTEVGRTTFECGSQKLIVMLKALLDSMGFITTRTWKRQIDNTHFKSYVKKQTSTLYGISLGNRNNVLHEIGSELEFYTQRLGQQMLKSIQLRNREQIPSLPEGFSLNQLGFNRVKKIEAVGEQATYDIQVEGTHNYFANGIVIHNTLVEDDIEDNSDTRRGKPCIHKIYGIDIAVNVGSAMFYLPVAILYNNYYKLNEHKRMQLHDLVAQELLKCHAGQAMDIFWHQGHKYDVSENEYLQMCAYKTGTLARLAAKIGAVLGDATPKQMLALGKFAETIGVAFQIQDDILNLVGEEFQKGKGVGEDIHEGKRTLMVIHCLKKASASDKKRLLEILNAHPSDQATINEAIVILQKYHCIDYARKKADALISSAWKQLDSQLKPSPAKQKLKAFADYLVSRKI